MPRKRKDNKNYDPMDSGSQSGSSFTGEYFKVNVYGSDRECTKLEVVQSGTCEDICEAVAENLKVRPVLFHCFGLCVFDGDQKRFLWLPPEKIAIYSGKEVYFRMRFMPYEENIDDLKTKYPACFQYLFYQLKWDFLHECLSYYNDDRKAGEARGAGMFLLMSSLRTWSKQNNKDENCKEYLNLVPDLKQFLPKCLLKNIVERMLLKSSLTDKVTELLPKYPKERGSAEMFDKFFVDCILKKCRGTYYSCEEYKCWLLNVATKDVKESDTSGHTSIVPELYIDKKVTASINVEFKGIYSLLQISSESGLYNTRPVNQKCRIESLAKVDVDTMDIEGSEWQEVTVVAQGLSEKIYFQDKMEMYSFLTALEKSYCLYCDFYGSICHIVHSQSTKNLYNSRVHGPVSNDFIKRKLQKYVESEQVYACRMSLDKYGYYDLLYLRSPDFKELAVVQIGKVVRTGEGYTIKDSEMAPVADLKSCLMQHNSFQRTSLSACTRIKPQCEGCDKVLRIMVNKNQLPKREEIEDDELARSRLESAPKVYMPTQVMEGDQIGVGNFTEVNRAFLNEDQQVIVKRLRSHPLIKHNHHDLQKALMDSVNKLMEWNSTKFFVAVLGICLLPEPSVLLSGTSFCSLKQFLISDRSDMPSLKHNHLIQVSVFLVEAVLYMDEKSCYHGNINCDNLVVERFDSNILHVKLTDPGMVAISNKLPLDHPVNVERLPWLAPERMQHLSNVTVKSEVWSIGTTMWQMFSGARNPSTEIQEKLGKARSAPLSETEVTQFFQDNKRFSRPKYLKPEPSDQKQEKNIKDHYYQDILRCWTFDSEDRPTPKILMKSFIEILQSYGSDYHTYSSMDYSGGSDQRSESVNSGGWRNMYSITRDIRKEVRDVPDISALAGQVSDGHPGLQNLPTPAAEAPPRLSNTLFTEAAGGWPTPSPNQSLAVSAPGPSGDRVSLGSRRPDLGALPAVPRIPHKIQSKHLLVDKNKRLGQGYYGAVYKANLTVENNVIIDVVAKILKSENPNEKDRAEFEKEAKVMGQLEHENIVKFYGTCDSEMGFCLVMDYLPMKSLNHYLIIKRDIPNCQRNKQDIPNCQFFQFAFDIASGMEYLESKKIMHCDLAARNVLLNSELRAKVCDFGLAKVLEKDYYRRRTDQTIPLYWSAPEWSTTRNVSHKSDVWSFGVVLWEMFSYGNDPKMNCDARDFVIRLDRGERLKQPNQCPDDVYSFMLLCWKKEPDTRPTFTQCKENFRQSLKSQRCSHENHRSIAASQVPPSDMEATNIHANGLAHGSTIAYNRQPRLSTATVAATKSNITSCSDASNMNKYSVILSEASLQIFVDQQIGHGAFGDVFMGRFEDKDVAVKQCRNVSEYPRFQREFELLYKLRFSSKRRHPNIVEFIGLYDLKNPNIHCAYVMEYADNKSLVNFLKKQQVAVQLKLKLLKDVADGMHFLFENRIIHCDLTAENILVKSDRSALISDFGWAKELELEKDMEDFTYSRSNLKTKILWSAPEVQYSRYTRFSDNWSFGVVCCEVFLDGKQPQFDGSDKCTDNFDLYWSKINKGERLPRPELCPQEIYDGVILRCWEKEYLKRIRFLDIIDVISSWLESHPS